MIVVDLEWHDTGERHSAGELLQIGAVKVGRTGKIDDCFSVYFPPSVPPTAYYQELLREVLVQCDTQGMPAARGLARFAAWCGQERCYATWGRRDMLMLYQAFKKNKLAWRIPPSLLDIQQAFMYAVGAKNQVSLSDAIQYCSIPTCFGVHDALYDAVYTACIARLLSPSECKQARYPFQAWQSKKNSATHSKQSMPKSSVRVKHKQMRKQK